MELSELRQQIDAIDREMVELFKKRMNVAADVAEYKRQTGMNVLDASRERALLDKVSNVRGLQRRDVYVDTDFLSEEITVDLKIAFSIRLWHIFHLAFGTLRRLIANRLRQELVL